MPCGFHWFLFTSFKRAVLGSYMKLVLWLGDSSKKKCVTSPLSRFPPRIPPVSAPLVPIVPQIASNTCCVMRNCLGHCICFTGSGELTGLPRPFTDSLECAIRYLLLHSQR